MCSSSIKESVIHKKAGFFHESGKFTMLCASYHNDPSLMSKFVFPNIIKIRFFDAPASLKKFK